MRHWYLVPIFALSVSCGRFETNQLSETKYRITAPSSAGLTWKVGQEKVRICYSDSTNSETHKEDTKWSVMTWVDALRDVSDSELASEVELVDWNADCDAKLAVGNYSPAYTSMGSKPTVHIYYNGWYGSRTVTLHEFGHAFGLLDTYNGRGGSCQTGQPDSVMCRASYDELKQDDINGIRAMYDKVVKSNGKVEKDLNEGRIVY